LDVPFDTKPDSYVVYATVEYGDTVGTGTDIARVVTEKEAAIQTRIVWSILLGTSIVVVVFLLSVKYMERIVTKIGRIKL